MYPPDILNPTRRSGHRSVAAIAAAALFASLVPQQSTGSEMSGRISQAEGIAPYQHFVPSSPAEGIIITIHGGTWIQTGEGPLEAQIPYAEQWLNRGFEVYNIDYRPRLASARDVSDFVTKLSRIEPRPICLAGRSAGGNLALLAARTNRQVDCAIAEAAPTDLPAFNRPGYRQFYKDLHKVFFNHRGFLSMSPATLQWNRRPPIFLASASNDHIIPSGQQLSMKNRAPWAKTMKLGRGNEPWIHSEVDAKDLTKLERAEFSFVKKAMRLAKKSTR